MLVFMMVNFCFAVYLFTVKLCKLIWWWWCDRI